MLRRNLVAALAFATLVMAQPKEMPAQDELPPGARVRLGTLDFLAESSVSAMAFSPDGKTLVWQGLDYGSNFTVRHWDLGAAKELHRFIGDDFGDAPQQFSIFRVINHNSLLRTSANGLVLMDLKTGEERVVTELARGKPSWISPDGKCILTYSTRGSWSKRTAAATFAIWDVEQSEKIREFTHEFKDAPAKADAGAHLTSVAFAPDGKTFASSWVYVAHGPMLIYRVGQLMSLWEIASGKERSLEAEAPYHLHFLDGGKTLACSDGRGAGGARSTNDLHHGTMEIWDVAANKQLHKFEGSVDWSGPLAFSPDGKLFASGGGEEENAVVVWRTATGEQVRKFTGHRSKVRFLVFSPDSRMLASGIDDILYKEKESGPWLAESLLVWDVQELR